MQMAAILHRLPDWIKLRLWPWSTAAHGVAAVHAAADNGALDEIAALFDIAPLMCGGNLTRMVVAVPFAVVLEFR
jgi:hypothetical protein